MKTSGMIVKITGNSCILLTSEGEYKKAPLPAGCRLGQIIELNDKNRFLYLRWLAVAASILTIVLGGQLWMGQMQPAAAYLTIDINPSVELAVAADQRVISARGLNSEGVSILQEVKVEQLHLHEAVELIVAQAINDQFLVGNGENIILVTLTTDLNKEPVADVDVIYESVKNQLELNRVDTKVIIEPVASSIRQEAEKNGISTGRYILLQNTNKKGMDISANEINSLNLGKLEKENKVSIVELIKENNSVEAADNKGNKEKGPINKGVYKKLQKSKDAYGEENIDYPLGGIKKANNNYEKTHIKNDINNKQNNKKNNKENNKENSKEKSKENKKVKSSKKDNDK
ncbi:MAG: anti-sigma factor domain-containing protein [Desulfotomaculaceae bacterium]|nr:anti-sigma factor domain-containing protein [Desulfotomaculaceae bacterium]